MDKFDRIYALHKLLSAARYPISRLQIERSLECKRGTIVRIISYMQDFLGAPLEYDPQANGWYYNHKATDPPYELPGLWFNTQELQSLAILSQLLDDLQPGILSEQLRPFEKRIETLLASKQFGHGEIKKSIRLLGIGVRSAATVITPNPLAERSKIGVPTVAPRPKKIPGEIALRPGSSVQPAKPCH